MKTSTIKQFCGKSGNQSLSLFPLYMLCSVKYESGNDNEIVRKVIEWGKPKNKQQPSEEKGYVTSINQLN